MEAEITVTRAHLYQIGYQRFENLELRDNMLQFDCPSAPDSADPNDRITVCLQIRGIDTIATLRRDIDYQKELHDRLGAALAQQARLIRELRGELPSEET